MLARCAKILALWKLLTAQLEQHAGWSIIIAMHEHGDEQILAGVLVDQYCMSEMFQIL